MMTFSLPLFVFWFSTGFVFWVVAGYPLLLSVWARRGRAIQRRFEPRSVTAIVAVRNGEHYLAAKLDSILSLNYPKGLLDVLVVSDGSTDSTDAIAENFRSRGVRLLRIPASGKPAALNAGIAEARGEILLLTDVRQPLEPDSLRHLIACFADPTVGAVSGTLRIRPGSAREEADIGLYWRYETWIREQLARLDSMFGATGPFYALRRSLAVPMPPEILLDDMYLPLAAFFQGYRLITEERAVAWDDPTSLDTEFRRKLRTLAGNYQLLRYYPALLGPRNRMWFHFVSYKLGRLLLPFALIKLAVSSFWMQQPYRSIALAAQIVFYGLAALDSMVPQRSALKRLTSPARTFFAMMAAAVCALVVFFVPPQSLWQITSSGPPRLRNPQKTGR
jgi:biofilm PGA synthesis N-glycosyltransferase PgaC